VEGLRRFFPFGANCGDGFVGFGFAGAAGADEIAVVDQHRAGNFCAALTSHEAIVAPKEGGRSTLPYSRPAGRRSE